MSMQVIKITIDTKDHEIPVRPFDEMTIRDWQRIGEAPEGESVSELLQRVFRMDVELSRRIPRSKAQELVNWYLGWITESAKINEAITKVSDSIQKTEDDLMSEGKVMTVEDIRRIMIQAGMHRDQIHVGGEVFLVPQNLGNTDLAQWDVFEEAAREHGSKPIAAMYAKILACLCLKPGETFVDAPSVEERTEFFMDARLIDATVVSAFFFSSDDDFSRIMLHNCPHFLALQPLSPA